MTAAPVDVRLQPMVDVPKLQRRTLGLLVSVQIIGGVGVASGVSVGALIAARMAGTTAAGLAGSSSVIGAALIAIPAARLMRGGGRRPGLVFAYLAGGLGAALVVTAVSLRSVPLLFVGTFLFGGSSAANLQSRYAAADLAAPDRRARSLSVVVWATTIGAVAGPNLAPYTDTVTERWGIPEYAGPYLFSVLAFGMAALTMLVFLRPDPLSTARALVVGPVTAGAAGPVAAGAVDPAAASAAVDPAAASAAVDRAAASAAGAGPAAASAGGADPGAACVGSVEDRPRARGVWWEAWRIVRASPGARLGIAALAVGHIVMVGVMSMTPVHIGSYVHDHGDLLRVVGLVISIHITGMYALSPVIGWAADRFGRRPVILAGVALLLLACGLTGIAGDDTVQLSVGMVLLGLGWGCTMVAGSTLLSESIPVETRSNVQGLSDVIMGVAGALAGALSGVVVDFFGYPTLSLLAAITVAPLIALVLRQVAAQAQHSA